jgi:DNA-binding protein HU-beta
MNRNELVEAVSSHIGFNNQDCSQIVDGVLEIIAMQMTVGEVVNIRGFGKFTPSLSPATRRRNPQTGGTVDVPEKTAVRFAASKTLKERVNA